MSATQIQKLSQASQTNKKYLCCSQNFKNTDGTIFTMELI